jgi:basic membrane lipoprotein Med (substrate-binding protein (PBP1-ABC) superfamily)
MRKSLLVAFSLLLVVGLLVGCAAPAPTPAPTAAPKAAAATAAPQPTAAPTAKPWKACFVYNSPIGDMGWVYAAEQGRQYVEKKLGIQTAYVENVPAGADAERVFSQFAEQGCDQIISTTNTYADAVDRVAPKYPKVLFESYEGFKGQPNLRVYRLAQSEAYYLLGVLAAKMTKNGQAGWVAGFPAPPYPSAAGAMIMGARSVNPNFTLKIVFMNKWNDPPGEKQAAESLAAAGAGLLSNSMSSPTVIQAAETAGLLSLGRTEQCKFGPKGCIASFIVGWGKIFEWQISTARAGKFDTSTTFWANLSNDGVGFAELSPSVPADVKQLLDDTKKKIASGELVYWKGPLKDNTGKERVPAGKVLTAEEVNLVDWFIDGVQTSAK